MLSKVQQHDIYRMTQNQASKDYVMHYASYCKYSICQYF
jgi:hypothetical protein